jgi:hypothetical protein
MFLSLILVPAAAYVAVIACGSVAYVSRKTGLMLGDSTDFYVSLGIPGFILIGSITVLLIAVLGKWRSRRWAVLLSAGALIVCILVCLHAAHESHRPFWSVIYHLE